MTKILEIDLQGTCKPLYKIAIASIGVATRGAKGARAPLPPTLILEGA